MLQNLENCKLLKDQTYMLCILDLSFSYIEIDLQTFLLYFCIIFLRNRIAQKRNFVKGD